MKTSLLSKLLKGKMTGILALLLAAAVMPPVSVSHALGFGTLSLQSHLGEKFSATVPLHLAGSETMKKVSVSVASAAEYRQMQLPWDRQLKMIRVEIHGRDSGAPYLTLSSPLRISSPLLSIVLKANKEGRGTYFRHYQIFLDPADPAPSAVQERQPEVMAIRDADQPQNMQIDDQEWTRIWRYGPVRSGDSISEIAYRLRKDKRFSNRQVMMALFDTNPDSFANGNINHLKKGAWLQVPKGDVVKGYNSVASMQKLSQLLAVKSQVTAGQAVASVKDGEPQELQYSGKIKVSEASGSVTTQELSQAVDLASLEKLDSIHKEMMAGKLQMGDLGKAVASLDKSVSGMKQDMSALKADVKLLKANMQAAPELQQRINYWMVAFFVLLVALLAAWIGAANHRRIRGVWDKQEEPVTVAKKEEPATKELVKPKPEPQLESRSEPEVEEVPTVVDIDPLLNKIEEGLGRCNYEQAEQLIEVAEEKAPDSLRLAALKAQLYHETDRIELRNELINKISESSDKQHWEEFIKVLPTHIWNACFGEGDGSA